MRVSQTKQIYNIIIKSEHIPPYFRQSAKQCVVISNPIKVRLLSHEHTGIHQLRKISPQKIYFRSFVVVVVVVFGNECSDDEGATEGSNK